MDIRDFNRRAWDAQVAKGNPWTIPVTPEQTAAARRGEWSLVLTQTIPVPAEWFPPLAGADVLCLASGGGLEITTIEGDMRDLSRLADASFDLIFHPVSNVFIPDVQPVWNEAFRVLRRGGALLAGFINPLVYIFDFDRLDEEGKLEVTRRLPYADLDALNPAQLADLEAQGLPLEWSHSLDE